MTLAVLFGAVVGLGLFVLVRALMPSRRGAVAQVARIDALRAAGPVSGGAPRAAGADRRCAERLGDRVAAFYLQQGWEQRSLRADLAVLDRGWEAFLATKVLLSRGRAVLRAVPLRHRLVARLRLAAR